MPENPCVPLIYAQPGAFANPGKSRQRAIVNLGAMLR
jgi:hypothetical protein